MLSFHTNISQWWGIDTNRRPLVIERNRDTLGVLAVSQFAANWNLPPRSNIASRRRDRDNIYIDIYTSDRSGRNMKRRDARATPDATYLYACMRHCASHVAFGWFKFQIYAKKRSESVDVNRYASISYRTWGKPSGCQYREQCAIVCAAKLDFLCKLLDQFFKM